MYKKIEELKTVTKINSLGGEKMFQTNLKDFDAFDPKVRLFSMIQVKPGEEVEYHMHFGESETFFFLSGRGVYNDRAILCAILASRNKTCVILTKLYCDAREHLTKVLVILAHNDVPNICSTSLSLEREHIVLIVVEVGILTCSALLNNDAI